jgi:hypothetical protein
MIVKCIRCEKQKELSPEELKESGEFVQTRKLGAVGFLKVLSLDMRETCSNGKNHEWEYEPEFDKEIHSLSTDVKAAKSVVKASEDEILECERIIVEATARAEAAKQRSIESGDKACELLNRIGEIAYIPDERLWS